MSLRALELVPMLALAACSTADPYARCAELMEGSCMDEESLAECEAAYEECPHSVLESAGRCPMTFGCGGGE